MEGEEGLWKRRGGGDGQEERVKGTRKGRGNDGQDNRKEGKMLQ